MSRIELTYVGREGVDDPNVEGAHIPGVPACDLILTDDESSEDEYADRIRANTQYQPPVLLTRRIVERLIVWHAFENIEGVALAERLAVDLVASGLYTTAADLSAAAPRFTDGREVEPAEGTAELTGDGSGVALPPIDPDAPDAERVLEPPEG